MSTVPSVQSANFQPPIWEAIVAAHARIAPRIHRTPVLTSASLDAITGARLFFKCENLQKTGSFKIRGASNAILSLTEEESADRKSTRLNSSHQIISYAVFCLKKKKICLTRVRYEV